MTNTLTDYEFARMQSTVTRAARIAFLMVACSVLRAEANQTVVVQVFQPRPLSIAEYISQLDNLAALARSSVAKPDAAQQAILELRGGWKVVDNDKSFDVQTSSIFDDFAKLAKKPGDDVRDRLLDRISVMKSDALAYQHAASDSTASHSRLTKILARGEFHQVHGPTRFDRLKYRVLRWLYDFLGRIFGSSAVPVVGKALVWGLVAIAVLVLAYFILRTIRQGSGFDSVIPNVAPISAKNWLVWMHEAQAAASQGLWREAVHLAYWAGISFLEQSGTWKPDKARTPREYLRLLPADSWHRSPLSNLTRKVEVTWYGKQPAGPETFSETVSLLEDLGCRQ